MNWIAVVPAVLVALLWVGGWTWRIKRGLLEQAESKAQIVAMFVLVASVPLIALALAVSVARS
jgi:hypothetical protein